MHQSVRAPKPKTRCMSLNDNLQERLAPSQDVPIAQEPQHEFLQPVR